MDRQGFARAGRGLVVALAGVVALGGMLVAAAAPASADVPIFTSVGDQGICLGLPVTGGCAPGFGTTTGVAGSTVLFGVTFTATSGTGSGSNIILEGTGTGIVFPDDAADYEVDNLATASNCTASNVAVYSSGQSAFVTMPDACAASPGAQVVVFVRQTVLPTTSGPFSIGLETTEDFEPVTTNAIDVVSPPSPPKNPSASRGNQSVTVSWETPDSDGTSPVTGYDVYCAIGTPSTAAVPSWNATASTRSVLIGGLSVHTTYSCVVTAVNDAGQSAPSDVVSAVPYTPPGVPRSFSTIAHSESVTILWDRPADVGGTAITEYTAYCSTSFPPPIDADHVCGHFGPAQRSGTLTGLTNGVTYYTGLTATNAAGESPVAGFGASTPSTVPSRPWAVRTKALHRSLVIRWKVPTSDGGSPINGYSLYCAPDAPPSGTGEATAVTLKNVFRLKGLNTATAYYCVVKASNSRGSSRASLVVSGTPT